MQPLGFPSAARTSVAKTSQARPASQTCQKPPRNLACMILGSGLRTFLETHSSSPMRMAVAASLTMSVWSGSSMGSAIGAAHAPTSTKRKVMTCKPSFRRPLLHHDSSPYSRHGRVYRRHVQYGGSHHITASFLILGTFGHECIMACVSEEGR